MTRSIIHRRFHGHGGVSIAADVGGDPAAPTVIFMHGGGQTRHSWGRAMRDLVAAGYHVINVDMRGHGESNWAPDGNYELDAIARDLLAIVSTLQVEPVFVGASLGGAAALHAVGHSCETVAQAVVLVDVVPRMEKEGTEKIRNFMGAFHDGFESLDQAVAAVGNYSQNRAKPADPSGLMKNLRRAANGRLHWHWDPKFFETAMQSQPDEFAEALLEAASRVRVPTLLVRGLMSDIVSDEGVEEFRKAVPGLEVHVVKGAGHMVAGDRNDAFNSAVTEFLSRNMPVHRK